jgi:hypothetical protein
MTGPLLVIVRRASVPEVRVVMRTCPPAWLWHLFDDVGEVEGVPASDTVTGHEWDDGTTWTEVGTVRLAGLPDTVEIGLFATSPGALWERAEAFDHITLRSADGSWRRDDVGVALEPDGRTPYHPGGAVASAGKLIVTGNGDIGPAAVEGGLRADLLPAGGALGLIPVLVTGLVASGVVVPAGLALLHAHQNPIQPLTLATGARVIVGYAALTAASAVLALGLAALAASIAAHRSEVPRQAERG